MRILQLEFQNLNALYGRWKIDFTAREFDGIFAITGATGAGKSTLLDAICLALYGRTPRLDKINGSSNEIMSLGTGECFAEITFLLDGKTYRANWSQSRAYKKKDGKLQNPKHEVAENGKILEEKVSQTPKKIEDILGLDFQRFTRTILLAQGQFAAFLSAKPEERAELLEKITGTEIYSNISIAVHERQREEKKALEKLELELDNITLKTPAEMDALKTEQTEIEEAARAEQQKWQEWQALIKQEEELEKLAQTAAQFSRAVAEKEAEKAEFAPEKARLICHQKAASEIEKYQQLITAREKLAAAIQTRENATKRQEDAEKNHQNAILVLEHISYQQQENEKKSQASQKIITSARQLDFVLPQLISARDEKRAELDALEKPREIETGDLKSLLDGKSVQFWRNQVSQAEHEARELEEIHKQFIALDVLKEKTRDLQDKQQVAIEEIAKQEEKVTFAKKTLQQASHIAEQQNIICKQARAIASLEEERAKLQPKQPCPLCGSRIHPYIDDQKLPSISVSEQDYQEALQREKAARQAFEQAREAMINAKQRADYLATSLQSWQEEIASTEKNLPMIENLPVKLHTAQQNRDQLVEKMRHIDAAFYHEAAARFDLAAQALAENRRQREAICGTKTVEQLENELLQEANAMREKLTAAEKIFHDSEKASLIAARDLTTAINAEHSTRADLTTANERFSASLANIGLADEAAFQQALLSDAEAEYLEQQDLVLEKNLHEWKIRLTDTQQALKKAQEKAPVLEVNPREEAEKLAALITTQQRKIGELQRQIDEQQALAAQMGEKRTEIDKQMIEFRRWSQLHELIGSGDGKKYRHFVQGLTLAALLVQANQQLVKMNKRYLLENDEQEALSLNVIDRFQNDERRSAKNLSGGEGFVVSLALALGLAQMSGQKTSLDSLFLDEGFGTLDEEALDQALEMLSHLQESGKLIGIISHVGTLKERINTQIQVQAGNHGRSKLQGAGIRYSDH